MQHITGRWVGKFPSDNKSIENEYQLEFTNSSKLVLNRVLNGIGEYNMVFNYNFIDKDQISLSGRLVDQWQISRSGNDLIIWSSSGLVENGYYQQRKTIDWLLISLTVSLLPSGFLIISFTKLPKIMRKPNRLTLITTGEVRNYGLHLDRMSKVFLFLVGFIILLKYWPTSPIWRVLLPWDGIISIELGAALLILGIKTLRVSKQIFTELIVLQIIFLNSLGALFLGSGLSILILGLQKLLIFLYFGYYPI